MDRRIQLIFFRSLVTVSLLVPAVQPAKGETDLVMRAKKLVEQGQLSPAKACLDAALAANPNSLSACELRGKVALMTMDFAGAESYVNHAYRLNPKSYETLLCMAHLSKMDKLYDKSREFLDRAIKVSPKRPDAYYERGRACLLQGLQNWAERDFTQAIYFGKQHRLIGYAYYWRGRCREMMGKYREAIADYTLAMKLDPGKCQFDAYALSINVTAPGKRTELGVLERGMCYFTIGDYRNAIKDFDLVMAQNPKETLMLEQRGEAYLFLMEHKKALRDFNRAILGKTASSDIYMKLGVTRYCLKMYDQAIRDLKTWLERTGYREDDTAACVALLSRIYLLQNDPISARSTVDACISKLRDKTGLPYEIMQLFSGKVSAASVAKKVDKSSKKEKVEALYCLGCYYLNKHERDKAMQFFSQVATLKPPGQIEYIVSLFELQPSQPGK